MNKESPYWMALAHLPRWHHLKLNTLIIKFYHERKIGIQEFFNLSESVWKLEYQLNDKEIDDLKKAKSEVANNAFLAETLLNEGYELIPIISSDYSKILKENLKVTYSPALLYIKGNKKILTEKSIAIVGSRDASKYPLSLPTMWRCAQARNIKSWSVALLKVLINKHWIQPLNMSDRVLLCYLKVL
jgi:DNA processing protein